MKENIRLSLSAVYAGSTNSIKVAAAWYADGGSDLLGLIGRNEDLIRDGIIDSGAAPGEWTFVPTAAGDPNGVFRERITATTKRDLMDKILDIARSAAAERGQTSTTIKSWRFKTEA